MQIFIQKLKTILDDCEIITEPSNKLLYEVDWRSVYNGVAIAVLLPSNIEQIVKIVKLCNNYNIKITPQGGNTSTCGGAVPTSHHTHVIINLKRMNRILRLDSNNSSIFIEAGTTLLELNQYLDRFGLFFPLKIASEASCQIGGNIATNAGGINVVKYGMMRNLVLGLEVITSNGEIINQTKVLYKDNTNFDIKQLFIGSEGTLGIVTKAVLKVYPKPQTITTIYLGVDSITQALDLKTKLNTNSFSISAFEIISKYTLEVYNNAFHDLREPLQSDWYLLIDIDNNEESLTFLSSILCDFSSNCIVATSTKERQYLWQIREKIPLAEKLSKPSVKFDISLPLDNIEIFLHQVGDGLKFFDCNIYMVVFGHLGDGNLHFNLQLDDIKTLSTIRDKLSVLVYSTLIDLNGSISAEHGIGVAKKCWYQKYEDHITFKYKKLIKNILDPKNIFNPNVIY